MFTSCAIAFGGSGQTSFYAGTTVNTPLSSLKLGASLDYLTVRDVADANAAGNDGEFTGDGTAWAGALYASYQATEKLSLNLRGEFADDSADLLAGENLTSGINRAKIWAVTATAQYDLWKNVVSRVEFRWDHSDKGDLFGGTDAGAPDRRNAFLLAAQFIYKF